MQKKLETMESDNSYLKSNLAKLESELRDFETEKRKGMQKLVDELSQEESYVRKIDKEQ